MIITTHHIWAFSQSGAARLAPSENVRLGMWRIPAGDFGPIWSLLRHTWTESGRGLPHSKSFANSLASWTAAVLCRFRMLQEPSQGPDAPMRLRVVDCGLRIERPAWVDEMVGCDLGFLLLLEQCCD